MPSFKRIIRGLSDRRVKMAFLPLFVFLETEMVFRTSKDLKIAQEVWKWLQRKLKNTVSK